MTTSRLRMSLTTIVLGLLATGILGAQVFGGNVIVQNSLCVGFDCPNSPSFSDTTILMMENNTRIKFDDTSNSASFPNRDWQIRANDSANGGENAFFIDDCGASSQGGCSTTPVFAIEAGAGANALRVDSGGRLGLGTNNPVLDIHVKTGNTPALRLEQDNTSGFTAQTWDVAGNEASFFIRDVTSGSKLPFRIRPGAPSSSIDIAADGDVGVGTAAPGAQLDVRETTAGQPALNVSHSNGDTFSIVGAFASTATSGNIAGGVLRVSSDQSSASNPNVVLLNLVNSGGEVFKVMNDGRVLVNTVQVHPDYVFEPDYALMPLKDLKQFVEEKKHLPGIPSAADLKETPLNITEFPVRLLEKVEELTLYILDQQKQLDDLNANNAELRRRLSDMAKEPIVGEVIP